MDAKFAEAATIAARQNGRITTKQLKRCGVGKSSIERGVDAGRLHRVHTGVFALGHLAPSRLGDWQAAVLACGDGAVLSHRCAATLMGIRDGVGPRVDVTIPTTSGRRRTGIEIHHGPLPGYEVGTWSDIPVTSPARTMVDLAHLLDEEDDVAWALRQLQYRRLFERTALELANRRRPNRVLTRLLDDLPRTASRLEVAFMSRVVRRHRLPEPDCQALIEGFHVDFHWPWAALIVEADGRNHDEPSMRAADAARDNILQIAGYRVLRYRWADVHRHHERTARQIRQALRIRHQGGA
jgi:very-short-patch-repair endonuclease